MRGRTTINWYVAPSASNNRFEKSREYRLAKNASASKGAVFVNEDGEQFVVSSAKTLAVAKEKQSVAGPEAKIFVVRPEFSMPAAEWLANDPAFWTFKHLKED